MLVLGYLQKTEQAVSILTKNFFHRPRNCQNSSISGPKNYVAAYLQFLGAELAEMLQLMGKGITVMLERSYIQSFLILNNIIKSSPFSRVLAQFSEFS